MFRVSSRQQLDFGWYDTEEWGQETNPTMVETSSDEGDLEVEDRVIQEPITREPLHRINALPVFPSFHSEHDDDDDTSIPFMIPSRVRPLVYHEADWSPARLLLDPLLPFHRADDDFSKLNRSTKANNRGLSRYNYKNASTFKTKAQSAAVASEVEWDNDYELWNSILTASSYSNSKTDAKPPAHPHLLDMPMDILLKINTYLGLKDLLQVASVDRTLRNLVLSTDSGSHNALWMPLYRQKWSFFFFFTARLQDALKTPMALVDTVNGNSNAKTEQLNNAMLLSLASGAMHPPPTGIDEAIIHEQQQRQLRRRRRRNQRHGLRGLLEHADANLLKMITLDNSIRAVHFTGPVGQGDRCIRANQPLSGPRRMGSKSDDDSSNSENTAFPRRITGASLFLLQRLANRLQEQQREQGIVDENISNLVQYLLNYEDGAKDISKPFVAPFVDYHSPNKEDGPIIQMAPRLISYYEVTIWPKRGDNSAEDENDEVQFTMRRPQHHDGPENHHRNVNGAVSDCVAVGLATGDFDVHRRMPGWDSVSIGYHGDDGGLFHGTGSPRVPHYGPSFGAGDTVGCGVDYHRKSFFYTLNGRFLGYQKVGSDYMYHSDLYPVVGIDTNCPVSCNFGTDINTPFVYDLTSMLVDQKNTIWKALGVKENVHARSQTVDHFYLEI